MNRCEKISSYCSLIPKTLLVFLTFVLPLKFGGSVGVPEMPMTYWNSIIGILAAAWPLNLFPVFAAFALISTFLVFPWKNDVPVNIYRRCFGWLWIALLLSSLPGLLHATTWDFAAQQTAHLLGMTCWVLALIRILERDPAFIRVLLGALLAGLVVSVYSAINQYLSGFDEMIQYLQNKEQQNGVKIMEGQFGNRLKEARVSGDFVVCNSYAGYLVLVFPLLLGTLWKFGGRVTPPVPARLILLIPSVGLFLFLLKETGSRGGLLAMLAGGYLCLLCIKLSRNWKIFLWTLIPVSAGLFILLVKLGRGFNSMLIRFDYFQAALKMMICHPLTGVGWGEFMNDYLILKAVVNDEAPHSPHNLVLTLGSQCGLPAFIFSLLILLLPLIGAVYACRKRECETESENFVPHLAAVWGLGAWAFHSMLDLDYETPGSFALAMLIALMLLAKFPSENKQLPAVENGLFLLCSILIALATFWHLPPVILAEYNFDRIFSKTDPRFANEPLKRSVPPEQVRQMLSECDPRSPFPFAEVSSYLLMQGPYYVEESLAMLDKAIACSPKRSAYYFRKYRILNQLPSRKRDAEAALQKARELSPKNPQYYPGGITPFGKTSY